MIPSGERQAFDRGAPSFHAMPMLHFIGADNFNLNESDARLFRDIPIRRARNLDGIDRVGYHGMA